MEDSCTLFPPSPPPLQQQPGHFPCLYFGCRNTRVAGSSGLGDTFHLPGVLQPSSLPLPSDVPHSWVCSQSPASGSPSIRARLEKRSPLPAPIPAGRTPSYTLLPAPSSPGKGGESRGAAPVRGLAPVGHGGRQGPWPYLGSAEERGRVREAAGGGEGHSLLQELLQVRRAGLGLRLRQALPQPAAWGERLQRDP